MPTTEEIRALCIERGWTREHDKMLKDGPWKMARPLYDGGWMGWVYINGFQGSERFQTPREAMEWCDEMKPRTDEERADR